MSEEDADDNRELVQAYEASPNRRGDPGNVRGDTLELRPMAVPPRIRQTMKRETTRPSRSEYGGDSEEYGGGEGIRRRPSRSARVPAARGPKQASDEAPLLAQPTRAVEVRWSQDWSKTTAMPMTTPS